LGKGARKQTETTQRNIRRRYIVISVENPFFVYQGDLEK